MHNLLLMDRKSPPIALEARQYEALPVLAANSGRLTGNREVMSWSVGLVPTNALAVTVACWREADSSGLNRRKGAVRFHHR